MQENAPAPVINIRQRTSADVAFREIQGCDAGLITDLHKADILRRSALADVQAGKYGSAYRKIVRAAAINPYSSPTAMDRSMIAALYRNRLDTYLYCILLPWLPFFIYTRMLAAAEGSEQGMLTGHELSVGGLFFFYILSLCAAGWIFVLRTRVK